MIKEQDLLDAIAECQGERNPNANTCMKLAAYYTILNQMYPEEKTTEQPVYSYAESPGQATYDSGSEFSNVIKRLYPDDVYEVMDELMDTVQVLIPKLYNATIEKLNNK